METEQDRLINILTAAYAQQIEKLFATFVAQLASGEDRDRAAQHFANGLTIIKEALRAAAYVVNAMDKIAGGNHAEDGARHDDNPRS